MPKSDELTIRKIKKFGWMPDMPDSRDHLFAAPMAVVAKLPASMDLRPQCPKTVYDQGQLGSCTANAIAGAVEFDLLKEKKPGMMPSRLFIYYNERLIEGTAGSDSGARIRDGIKVVNKLGAPPESDWPYVIDTFAERPPAKAYTDAKKHRATSYSRVVQDLTQMRGCLAAGFPFVVGFTVYTSFESQEVARTGVVPMPDLQHESVLGGHAVLAVGYDDGQQRFILRNSWGAGWGMAGYFTMPYAYLISRSLASDFWTIRVVK
jgi:C1A family cysteine protease